MTIYEPRSDKRALNDIDDVIEKMRNEVTSSFCVKTMCRSINKRSEDFPFHLRSDSVSSVDMEEDEWENVLSEHFGHTPLTTPFGSQDSCAIDLSEDETSDEETHLQNVAVADRVRQYIDDYQAGHDVSDIDLDHDSDIGDDHEEIDEDLEKIRQMKIRGCGCQMKCAANFSEKDMYKHLLNVQEMDKTEKDMYIMGSLGESDCDGETKRGKKRMRTRRNYNFLGKPVCKNMFRLVFGVGEKTLKNLLKHIDENGAVPRRHGNKGKRKPSALSFDDVMCIVNFIINYADLNGVPQPAAARGRDNAPPTYLHCQTTKKTVHADYTDSLSDTTREVKYTTFVKIWNNCVPHIQIATPRDDVCGSCEKMRKKQMDARSEEEKLQASENMSNHINAAQDEREVYNDCIQRAMNGNPDGSPYHHFTFDFCQNVSIPHHGRQMGPLFFTTPRKIQIFGVRIDHLPKQVNFLIDEDQTIGEDGSLAHGPNAVISMIDWVLDNYETGATCSFHADNCPGQNKNRFVLGYFQWRVMTGRHSTIELMMQVPGHARCRVDSGFGLIKQLFRRSDCDTIDQVETVVNNSAVTNQAVRYPAWQWRDWKSFLGRVFHAVKGIRSYQYFRFSSDKPGVVIVRESRHGDEKELKMLKDPTYVFDTQMPNTLSPGGLTLERQRYLYRTIRQFVQPLYQDDTCPEPIQE